MVCARNLGVSRLRTSDVGIDGIDRPKDVPEGSIVSVFRVPPELAGQRLDVFMQGELKRTSRTRTQVIIENSAFDAFGKRLRSNYRVKSEELVVLWRPPWDEDPVPTDVPILYEDEHLLAVDKPALLPVHPTARYYKNTLIEVLKRARPKEFVSLGHRIDRETSGVLLVSKTPECDRTLKRQLEERADIEKTYLALTWNVPEPARNGETAFRYERSVELDPTSRYKVKMRLGIGSDALYAATRFVVEATKNGYARMRCDLETGRQHQIRLHLASLGAPIVGDKLYGPDESCFARGADGELTEEDHAILELPRHALHAARLSLDHPMIPGKRLVIEAPLPKDLSDFWESRA